MGWELSPVPLQTCVTARACFHEPLRLVLGVWAVSAAHDELAQPFPLSLVGAAASGGFSSCVLFLLGGGCPLQSGECEIEGRVSGAVQMLLRVAVVLFLSQAGEVVGAGGRPE